MNKEPKNNNKSTQNIIGAIYCKNNNNFVPNV